MVLLDIGCPGHEGFQFWFYNKCWGQVMSLTPTFIRLYVNSWGRGKKQNIASRVGVKAPARFLCTGEKDSVSEIAEITHPKADPFQDFGLVVAAFNKTV